MFTLQHPVEHWLLLVQSWRQPAWSLAVLVTHKSLQHWSALVQLPPCFVQGLTQRSEDEHTACPVSALSKQQPVAQSLPDVHGIPQVATRADW